VIDFFHALEQHAQHLPTWNGELYLEYHRGTYTTQARNKKANRKSEFLLHDAEFLATYASVLNSNYDYPYQKLTEAWQLVCLNQFHDIIPGSSIGPVYIESLEQYNQVRQVAEEIRQQALAAIAETMNASQLVVNPAPVQRAEAVRIDGNWVDLGELPAYSIRPLKVGEEVSTQNASGLKADPSTLENDFLRVEFNPRGDIFRIYDKSAGREVLPEGQLANQFLAFEDIPLNWDAWDIDVFYDDKTWLAEPASSIQVLEEGPFRASLQIKRRILNSDYTQTISLNHNAPRLDFETHINWQERQILLKVAFPVKVFSPKATYEIQWGNVERPTHRNTSWDWARFETAAQKWVDLSEGDYGVSLLNDCKYGHDIHDHIMRLTLLRGTTAPDPRADQGEHTFNYALLPHVGSWGAGTVAAAYCLNDPILTYQAEGQQADSWPELRTAPSLTTRSFAITDRSNIIIETIKRAEDGRGIILRLYENQRQRGEFTLTTAFPLASAWRSNILEQDQEVIQVSGNQLRCPFKPYQIITLRLMPVT
jgi:alpha-mannosidase